MVDWIHDSVMSPRFTSMGSLFLALSIVPIFFTITKWLKQYLVLGNGRMPLCHTLDKRLITEKFKWLTKLINNKTNAIHKCGERMWTEYSPKKRLKKKNSKNIKKSKSLITRETCIKSIIRYYIIPVRMSSVRKNSNNRCWRDCRVKLESFLHSWWKCKLV